MRFRISNNILWAAMLVASLAWGVQNACAETGDVNTQAGGASMPNAGYKLAIKTNLLFDAALAPNIEVERWFGKHNHWSVMAEVWFPWYIAHHNSRAYEVLNIGAELRYWMFPHNGNLRPLHGQFIGVYGAGGKYDVEWGSKGDQGEYTSMGLTYGYAFRLSRHFNMELSLSGGYMGGPFRHYQGLFHDTHLIWQRTEHRGYWGPTKAKVSLVWLW